MNVARETVLCLGGWWSGVKRLCRPLRSYDYRTSKFEYFAHIHGGPRRLAATTIFQGWREKRTRSVQESELAPLPNNVQLQEMVNQITMPAYTQKVLL